MSNADIIYMVRSGLSSEIIVNSIHSRGGRFDTTPEAIVQLKANGVGDYLIQVMQSTPLPSATVPPPMMAYGAPPPPAVGVVVRPYWGWGWR